MTTTVWLVPHTHWDREWYEPFQRFRLRLVDLMDDVVARAEREPDFRFTMDGQMAAVDDYLEVRPDQTEAVRALVDRGQLAIGPWRVLMDEFLCSGETMIRNLEMGWTDASRLGAVMPIGYLPDMFGHCAQMPQQLRQRRRRLRQRSRGRTPRGPPRHAVGGVCRGLPRDVRHRPRRPAPLTDGRGGRAERGRRRPRGWKRGWK